MQLSDSTLLQPLLDIISDSILDTASAEVSQETLQHISEIQLSHILDYLHDEGLIKEEHFR